MGYVGVSSGLHLGIFYDFVGFCLVNLAFKVSFRVAFGFHLKFVLAQGFFKVSFVSSRVFLSFHLHFRWCFLRFHVGVDLGSLWDFICGSV